MKSSVVVLKDNFDAIRKSITSDVLKRAAAAGGHVIEGHGKVNASRGRPGLEVQSGALVNSIHVSEGESSETRAEVHVGPTVVYARIHEYGGVIKTKFATIVIPARPYMRPAVDDNQESISGAAAAEISRSLDRASN